jgi:hypothetical protein
MSWELQAERSEQVSGRMTLEPEPNRACGGGALQASSGIAMGVLLGAGTWVVLGGFTFIIMNYKAFLS